MSALLAGIAVIASALVPALPAAAEEPPAPTPVVEPVETPTPVVEPVETPTPTPTPTAAPGETISYVGTLQRLAEDGNAIDENIVLLGVNTYGWLQVDISALTPAALIGSVNLTFSVPEGLVLSSDGSTRFTQLANYSTSVSPLVAVSAGPVKQIAERETAALVNQTPMTAGTHHIYAVLVSPNSTAKSSSQTGAKVATSVAHANTYWSDQSGGGIGFTLDKTLPWYQSTYSCKTNSGSAALWNQAMAKAKTAGFVPGKNNHLALFFPSNANCAGSIGLGTIGGSVNQGGLVWVIGTDSQVAQASLAHELGHNMSLGHADWAACPSVNPLVGRRFDKINYNDEPEYDSQGPFVDCEELYYGDVTDVMGFGLGSPFGTGGALSSPNAIRSGIWPSDAWATAPVAVDTPYTLQPVSGHSGLRSVVVQDTDGQLYFVEYRNQTNEDAAPSGFCGYYTCSAFPEPDAANAIVFDSPNVRILRFEPEYFAGYPGYDTFVIGRNYYGAGYTGAGTFWTGGSVGVGMKIEVVSVSGSSASIKITRTAPVTTDQDWVILDHSVAYDSKVRVGDTLTALLGDWWNATSYVFHWTRDGSEFLTSSTAQTYTLTNDDRGHVIDVYVTSTPTPAGGYVNFVNLCPNTAPNNLGIYSCNGPTPLVASGVYQAADPGTVLIDNSATPLQAVLDTDWLDTATPVAYQWYRGTTAITGATHATYTPTSADYNQLLKVRVSLTVLGYGNTVKRYSAAKNYSITSTGAITLAGTPQVGTEFTIGSDTMSYSTVDGAVSPSFAYRWLRNGVPISGTDAADDADYTTQSADYGTKLSLRVTASSPGWVSKVYTTPAVTISLKGDIANTGASPTVTPTPTSPLILTSDFTGVVTEPNVTTSYQWYRVNPTTLAETAITGATLPTYKPVTADHPYELKVRVTVKKLNYTSIVRFSTATRYSVIATPTAPVIINEQKVGQQLEIGPRTYTDPAGGDITEVLTYQWYRSGVAISGAEAKTSTYVLKTADKGYKITVKVTAAAPGLISSVATSASTQSIGTNTITGWDDPFAPVTFDGSSTDYKTVLNAGNQATAGFGLQLHLTLTYQWYRGSTAIPNATSSKYTLTSADRNANVWVRVKVTKPASGSTTYTPSVKSSPPIDYTLYSSGGVFIHAFGTLSTGIELTPQVPTYTDHDGNVISPVSQKFQWYRTIGTTTTAITGATNSYYFLKSADVGARITVKVTTGYLHFIAQTATITTDPPTTKVVKGTLLNTATAPTVTVSDPATNELLATPPDVTGQIQFPTSLTQHATFTYQWLRDNLPIANATASKYKLQAADWGKDVSVSVKANLSGYNSVSLPQSTPIPYSITLDGNPSHVPRLTGGYWRVGESIQVVDYANFLTKDGPLVSPPVTFQWYRAGVAIPGETNASHLLVAADYHQVMSLKYTVKSPGYVPLITTLSPPPNDPDYIIEKGVTATVPTVEVESGPGLGTLVATVSTPSPALPAPSYKYQWTRDTVAITGATLATYKLTSADFGKDISVKVTMTRTNFNPAVTQLEVQPDPAIDYSIKGDDPAVLSGTPSVGATLHVDPPVFLEPDNTPLVLTPTYTYRWYSGTTLLTTTTVPDLVVPSSWLGKTSIRVKVTASAPGRLARTTPGYSTPALGPIVKGTIVPGAYHPLVTMTNTTLHTMSVSFSGTPTVPASDGFTKTYKWYREGVVAPISTASTYNLAVADTGKEVTLVVTLSLTGFNSLPLAPILVNGLTQGEPAVITGGDVVGDTLTCVAPIYYLASGEALDPDPVTGNGLIAYQWFHETTAIPGATGSEYIVDPADENSDLYCDVTAAAVLHDTLVEKTDAHNIPS
jgi:hypothetical protein